MGGLLFVHVPLAWAGVLGFVLTTVFSARYLWRRGPGDGGAVAPPRRDPEDDRRAAEAARLGLWFSAAAGVTGAIWARVAWGLAWNWDVRQTTLAALVLVYVAYLTLRSAVSERGRRAFLSAVYGVWSFWAVPVLGFVVPRLYGSLHPAGLSGALAAGGEPVEAAGWLGVGCLAATFVFLGLLLGRHGGRRHGGRRHGERRHGGRRHGGRRRTIPGAGS
jgi:heme exporter protein C